MDSAASAPCFPLLGLVWLSARRSGHQAPRRWSGAVKASAELNFPIKCHQQLELINSKAARHPCMRQLNPSSALFLGHGRNWTAVAGVLNVGPVGYGLCSEDHCFGCGGVSPVPTSWGHRLRLVKLMTWRIGLFAKSSIEILAMTGFCKTANRF